MSSLRNPRTPALKYGIALIASLASSTTFNGASCQAQTPATAQTAPAGGDQATAVQRSWLVRDPTSGRLFQQEIVDVKVPTTRWEPKPMTTTVYEPRRVVKNSPVQQTVYTPTTQYVLQPHLRGWWNPLRQPVQAYQYVPLTTWRPQTKTVSQAATSIEWIPRQQVVYVPQPVQKVENQQRLVTRELPQPSLPTGSQPPVTVMAQNRPLISVPLLARQRMLPWPSAAMTSQGAAAATEMRNTVDRSLRPIADVASQTTRSVADALPNSGNYYSAPLQTASFQGGYRDAAQAGMSATVLR